MSTPNLEYVLDEELRLLSYNRAENDAFLKPLVGKPILAIVRDTTLHMLLDLLFRSVARNDQGVTVHYRCDTPTLRRACSLVISPVSPGPGRVRVENRIDKVDTREAVQLLDPDAKRSSELVCVCSWCKKIRVEENRWVEIEEGVDTLGLMNVPVAPRITHGMCGACYRYLMDKIGPAQSSSVTGRKPYSRPYSSI
ncbi:hypothetical protein [Nibricoccus sp. IMCC34717]|uniref:hypothetical protein n=1 Tax=Nibricoccus sp. IMCC34717 TaxID=3034021 RepID=UPI00384D4007